MIEKILISLTTSLENKIKQISSDNLDSQKNFFKGDFYQLEEDCNSEIPNFNSELKNFLFQVTSIPIYPKITVVSHTSKSTKIAIGTVLTSENPNELSSKSSIVCGGKTFPYNNLSQNNSWENFPQDGFWVPEIYFKIENNCVSSDLDFSSKSSSNNSPYDNIVERNKKVDPIRIINNSNIIPKVAIQQDLTKEKTNILHEESLSGIKIVITSQKFNALPNLLNKIKDLIKALKTQHEIIGNQNYLELFSTTKKIFNPNFNNYSIAFSKVQKFLNNDLDNCDKKVVLARQTSFQIPSQLNLKNIFDNFLSNFNNGYFYSFQASKLNLYVGITPEILFRRNKNNIETEALAGTLNTILKGDSQTNPDQQLLGDEKNTTENNVVSKYITKKLLKICSEIQTTKTETLSAGKLIHLRKKIFAKLNNQVLDPDFEILKLLHPTPSMAGTPLVDALKIIFDSENYNRGWYASPIGFVEKDQSEFIILIRGILLADNSVKIYTGSGIITKSKLLDEWEELNDKTNAILANLLSG